MQKKVLFIYEFDNRTPSQVVQTNRKLFGYIDHSYHGKYIYHRKGLLSHLDIERLTKGVLLTDEVNDKEVLNTLHSMGTKKIKRFYLDVRKVVG